MAPKSILKKPVEEATSDAVVKSRDERNKEIALYHANLIQAQKDVEAAILEAIETLIDFPSDAASTSSAPANEDMFEFKKLINPFTPTDYDELIEERRIDNTCGYIFCSNAPRISSAGGKLKIVNGGKIMDRARAESWCSNECAKRTLFIKVQLMETPAWERRAGTGSELEILTGKMEKERAVREKLRVDREDMEAAMRELALERGDGNKPVRAIGVVAETVVERNAVKAPAAPEQDEETGDAIEGYVPKTKPSKEKEKGSELGDNEWNI
jgi:hypothetical protein